MIPTPPAPGGSPPSRREEVPPWSRQRYESFARALIDAGRKIGGGDIRWPAFTSRAAVETILAEWGYELVIDGARFDPKKCRFFAISVDDGVGSVDDVDP
jgi:hypothetical protein